MYNNVMEIRKLKKENMKEIMALYADIKTNSHTFWEDDYPNEEIVNFDIERNGLYGGYENGSLVAICFAGQRCEDGEENFTWKQPFKKRASFARIGVSPSMQRHGFATQMLEYVFDDLRKQGFDGVRILVERHNEKAKNLYHKFGFKNVGETERYGHEFYLYEMKL